MDPINHQEILAWYRDAGVDVALLDNPVNRFNEKPNSATIPRPSPPSKLKNAGSLPEPPPQSIQVATPAIVPDENVIAAAQEGANDARTLEDLQQAISEFTGCNLKNTARTTVFADGTPGSRVMLVGEAPGRDEDEQGLPFVGRSGQLLDRMLAAIGFHRSDVYITNVLPWRPPGNRAPTPMETEICRPFIERHIELAAPEIVLLVGGSSAKTLLKTSNGIMNLRGKWTSISIADRQIPALPILHPAYLLRQPNQKRLAWQDLVKLKHRLTPDPEGQAGQKE